MFGSTQLGANAYANIGVETGVAAVSPHKLITMLFDGALIAISMGEKYMKAGDIKKKGESITQAILIIEGGLRTSLDKNAGGEIASNLDALYEYMGQRLLVANVENSTSILKEVHDLLDDLRDAWRTIGLDGADPMTTAA
ncbi:MAG TPA: flagellar export chaperone FliS [Herbaspirillum sp.]|jgi:flagellar protein FliS|nr:flagellar export chaperone FliS [Herbaspirillum sp.]